MWDGFIEFNHKTEEAINYNWPSYNEIVCLI